MVDSDSDNSHIVRHLPAYCPSIAWNVYERCIIVYINLWWTTFIWLSSMYWFINQVHKTKRSHELFYSIKCPTMDFFFFILFFHPTHKRKMFPFVFIEPWRFGFVFLFQNIGAHRCNEIRCLCLRYMCVRCGEWVCECVCTRIIIIRKTLHSICGNNNNNHTGLEAGMRAGRQYNTRQNWHVFRAAATIHKYT